MLHVYLNNNTGEFRIVRPPGGCPALHGESKSNGISPHNEVLITCWGKEWHRTRRMHPLVMPQATNIDQTHPATNQRREYTMLFRRALMSVLIGITIGWTPLPTQAGTTVSTVTLDQAIFFTAPDGNDIVAEAGTYTVQPADDAQLRLLPQSEQPAIEMPAASISHGESLHAPLLLQAISTTHTETIAQATALLIRGEQEDQWHLVYLTPDGKRLDAVGTTADVSSRGVSGIVSPRDRANFRTMMTQPGPASVAITPKPPPALTAELERLAAERERAKAELEPQALLARIKVLEGILACMDIEPYGKNLGPPFPSPPKLYPIQRADMTWSGVRCPGK